MPYTDNITYLKGVGPKKAEQLNKLGIYTVGDLLSHYPASYLDATSPVAIADAVLDETNIIRAEVVSKKAPAMIRKGMTLYKLTVTDGVNDMLVTMFNTKYTFDSLEEGESYLFMGKVTGNFTRREMSSPQIIPIANQKILPIYHLTEGINQKYLRDIVARALETVDASYETLTVSMMAEHKLIPIKDALRLIHFPKNETDLAVARKRLAFDELLTLQLGMRVMREKNRRLAGAVMKPKDVSEYYNRLPYELTGAQKRAISDCLNDMTSQMPMNRLILGDVGSGKTAVAAACCYFAHLNGAQSVLMAPTEILAQQHYETLSAYLEPLGAKVALLTGSLTPKSKTALRQAIKAGEYTVVVGTHALFQNATEFYRLGLVIADEQHRFGVTQRAKLAAKGDNPHRLVMSATPIPRTMALMIYGELDISYLDEMPKGRLKIETYAVTSKLRQRAYSFIKSQLDSGRQAYIVCPAIEETDGEIMAVTEYQKKISQNEFKGYSVGLLHGKLPAEKKDAVMRDFKAGKYQLLVSTTVVEVGVDVSNATVMLIENAEMFGLSQLHQLRGRVGRGAHQSTCILISDNTQELTRQRLKVLSNTNDGFEIAEADLSLRGPGDFFGQAQHGLPKLKIAGIADSQLIASASLAAESIYAERRVTKALKERVRALFRE